MAHQQLARGSFARAGGVLPGPSQLCHAPRICSQQLACSTSAPLLTPAVQPAPSRRSTVVAAKKKPRFQDFDDLDMSALASMGSMDEVGSAAKYADLIKQNANGTAAQPQQPGAATTTTAKAAAPPPPAKTKQPATSRPPADFGFGDGWGSFGGGGGGYQNGGGYGGGFGGGYQNGGGYQTGYGGQYGGYMTPGNGGYGAYINNTPSSPRKGPGGRYDAARSGQRNRNGRSSLSFMDDDDLAFDSMSMDDADAPEIRPDSVVINGKTLQANNGITAKEVFLLGPGAERKPMGTVPIAQALALAREAKEDLLLITPDASPPVARIIEWSKYKYELEKGAKEKKAKATTVEVKEVRLRPSTDVGDVATKIKSCIKFLEKGNKVKLVMKFEGRELQFKDTGKEVLLKFIEDIGEMAKVEGPLNFKSATYMVLLAPNK